MSWRRKPSGGYQIDFYYRAVRCRETVALKYSKSNDKYVGNLDATIQHEIAMNTFEYFKYFPSSKTHAAKIFGNSMAGNTTVEEALHKYFEAKKRTWKTSTCKTNLQSIKSHLSPAFRDVRLTDLNVGVIRQWVGSQMCSNKRINNMLIPLRGMLKDAHSDGLIKTNPMDRIHNLKINTRDPKPFNKNEQSMILEVLPTQAKNLFQFAFHTGLRTGELIALRWSDIDFDRGVACVRRSITLKEESSTKTNAGNRDVMLFPPALEALDSQRQYTFKLSNRIFNNPNTDKPWIDDGQIRKRFWIPALKKANIEYREPYQTRHTYASFLLTIGEPVAWIARQMGHTDPSVLFKRYARWVPEIYPHAGEKARAVWSHNGH
ncbi:MAG: tyrosine-type recombinase/integrase [Ghiorsea sp.]